MSVRFLVFSDFHAHNFAEGASRVEHEVLPGLFNSRLIAAGKAIDQICDYAEDNGIELVLFAGDMFHSRSKLDVDVVNVLHYHLRKLADSTTIYAIAGNHDYADKFGNIHSLSPLADSIRILEGDGLLGSYMSPNGTATIISGVPYTDSLEEAKIRLQKSADLGAVFTKLHEYKILLAHLGMQGAKVGSDYVLIEKTDIQVSDVPYDSFDVCLFGHFHEHQQLFGNGWYVGATFQHNWGDANTKRGFLDITLDKGKKPVIKQIECEAPPKYWVLDKSNAKKLKPLIREQDLVRITDDTKSDGIVCSELQEIPKATKETKEEVELPVNTLDPRNMIEFWVKDKQGSDDLIELGKSILAMAAQDDL